MIPARWVLCRTISKVAGNSPVVGSYALFRGINGDVAGYFVVSQGDVQSVGIGNGCIKML